MGFAPLCSDRYGERMGLTRVHVTVRHPRLSRRSEKIDLLVDSGAAFSVLPEIVWKKLGLKAARTVTFALADATTIRRDVSEAEFVFRRRRATSPVVLGGPDDEPLLGVLTLETLGLVLNPLTRELLPARLRL